MNAIDILSSLPASLDWMVFFRLSALRPSARDPQIKAMFFLPEEIDLEPFSHVVLTSAGRYLAPENGRQLCSVNASPLQSNSSSPCSLLDRYRTLLENLPSDEPDCLGLGTKPGLPPVLLRVLVEDGYAEASALFHRGPSERNFELLKSVGVEYRGGYSAKAGFVALFRNRLRNHLDAGSLASYSRTGNCNQFFLNHGEIDDSLESGLILASDSRIAWGREAGLAACGRLGSLAWQACLAMTCQPPPPQKRFGYGDLVPLGFLLKALTQALGDKLARPTALLREKLLASRQDALWPFHSRRLVTATDSTLVLQAFSDREGVEALERFSNGRGQYYPQLWSQTKQPGRMVISEANAHWCQPDFATTCLVRSLRAELSLSRVTPLQYLEDHFETRAGLYFANPYLTDWTLANALRNDAEAASIQNRLLRELLASMNKDFSFGTYDVALSTSFAILALAALGYRGRSLRLSQLSLLDMIDASVGMWPVCTPFYSTIRSPGSIEINSSPAVDRAARSLQILDLCGSRHELSLYIDTHRIIATAVAVLALSESCDPRVHDLAPVHPAVAHPRYKCRTHAEYVAEFGLPPYVESLETRSYVA